MVKNDSKQSQQGFSAWALLPFVLLIVLGALFYFFVQKGSTPATTVAIAPVEQVRAITDHDKVSVNTTQSVQPVYSYRDAVSRAAVSVVNIYTTQKVQNPYANDPRFQEFLQYHGYDLPQAQDQTNLGSGVIVSKDGYIITNAHVVQEADEIVVVLSDGRKAAARIIGSDSDSDLAVIKIDLEVTPITFKKDDVQVGDVTLAIGNPFGVGQTVTQGIVSATGRTGLGMNTYEDFIQTDAAINPGNSGGALVDANGELIGINTMIYSRSGGSMGIGFAIAASNVEKVMNDIIAIGKVSRGWLGIEVGQIVSNPASLEQSTGVLVARVMAEGPADVSGVQRGDVILQIDGQAVADANHLIQLVAKKAPNTPITLTINRNNQQVNIIVTLAERPNSVARAR